MTNPSHDGESASGEGWLSNQASADRPEMKHTLDELPRPRLTASDLKEIETRFKKAFPDADQLFIRCGAAYEVLLMLMGPKWFRSNLGFQASQPWFSPEASPAGYLHQSRVIGLAKNILASQDIPHFDSMITDLRTRSVVGAAAELFVATGLQMNGRKPSFVPRTGVKGADYDLLVEGRLAVEIKTKADESSFNPRALARLLDKARGQLPRAGPGAIFLRMPTDWLNEERLAAEISSVFSRIFRNSRRINAIVLLWEEWVPVQPQGMALMIRHRTLLNERPASPFLGVDSLLPPPIKAKALPGRVKFIVLNQVADCGQSAGCWPG